MKNKEKFIQSFTDLVSILYDVTGEMAQELNRDNILIDMELVDRITNNLKRMGETSVLDINQEIIPDIKNTKIKEVIPSIKNIKVKKEGENK